MRKCEEDISMGNNSITSKRDKIYCCIPDENSRKYHINGVKTRLSRVVEVMYKASHILGNYRLLT